MKITPIKNNINRIAFGDSTERRPQLTWNERVKIATKKQNIDSVSIISKIMSNIKTLYKKLLK